MQYDIEKIIGKSIKCVFLNIENKLAYIYGINIGTTKFQDVVTTSECIRIHNNGTFKRHMKGSAIDIGFHKIIKVFDTSEECWDDIIYELEKHIYEKD